MHRLCSLVLVAIFILSANASYAEPNAESPWQGITVGFDIGSVAGNLSQGLRVASPSFLNGLVRGTLSGHFAWAQNVMSFTDFDYTWLPFGLFKLGLHVGNFVPDAPIRVSAFADLVMAVPSLKISDRSVLFGLDGGVDIEIFLSSIRKHAVSVALGGIGLFSPKGDGLKNKPSFANGFTTSFGYRYFF